MYLGAYSYGCEVYGLKLQSPDHEEDQHQSTQYRYTLSLDIVALKYPAF